MQVNGERTGQVWWGPHTTSNPHVYLVLWETSHDEYMVLNLETGELTDFLTKNIDLDENWRRL